MKFWICGMTFYRKLVALADDQTAYYSDDIKAAYRLISGKGMSYTGFHSSSIICYIVCK